MVLVLVLVVPAVVFRTGRSGGKPLLLPVLKKTTARTTKTTTRTTKTTAGTIRSEPGQLETSLLYAHM